MSDFIKGVPWLIFNFEILISHIYGFWLFVCNIFPECIFYFCRGIVWHYFAANNCFALFELMAVMNHVVCNIDIFVNESQVFPITVLNARNLLYTVLHLRSQWRTPTLVLTVLCELFRPIYVCMRLESMRTPRAVLNCAALIVQWS